MFKQTLSYRQVTAGRIALDEKFRRELLFLMCTLAAVSSWDPHLQSYMQSLLLRWSPVTCRCISWLCAGRAEGKTSACGILVQKFVACLLTSSCLFSSLSSVPLLNHPHDSSSSYKHPLVLIFKKKPNPLLILSSPATTFFSFHCMCCVQLVWSSPPVPSKMQCSPLWLLAFALH